MNVEKLLRRLREKAFTRAELRRAARDLGHELPRRRDPVLRAFRSGLAGAEVEDPYAEGYVAALLDVTAAFCTEIRETEARGEAAAELARRPNHIAVLEALQDHARRPKELADQLGKDPALVSRVLRDLQSWRLVEGFEMERDDRRARPRRLTLAGNRILSEREAVRLPEAAQWGVDAALSVFERLSLYGWASRLEVERSLGSRGPSRSQAQELVRRVFEHVAELRLVRENGGCVEVPPAGDASSIEVLTREGFGADLTRQLAGGVPAQELVILIRAKHQRYRWEQFLKSEKNPFPRAIPVGRGDLRDPPTRDLGQTVLLYDDDAWVASERRFEDVKKFDRIALLGVSEGQSRLQLEWIQNAAVA